MFDIPQAYNIPLHWQPTDRPTDPVRVCIGPLCPIHSKIHIIIVYDIRWLITIIVQGTLNSPLRALSIDVIPVPINENWFVDALVGLSCRCVLCGCVFYGQMLVWYPGVCHRVIYIAWFPHRHTIDGAKWYGGGGGGRQYALFAAYPRRWYGWHGLHGKHRCFHASNVDILQTNGSLHFCLRLRYIVLLFGWLAGRLWNSSMNGKFFGGTAHTLYTLYVYKCAADSDVGLLCVIA